MIPLSVAGVQQVLTLLALSFIIVSFVVKFFWHPLSCIPGPRFARVSSLWLVRHARHGVRFKEVDAAHKKYGPVIRIAPNHVSLADKNAIPIVFAHGTSAMDKSAFYDAFVSETPSIFSTRDRAEHARKRRNYSRAFSSGYVANYQPSIHACLSDLLRQFDHFCSFDDDSSAFSEWVDLLSWANYFAFDVLSDLAFVTQGTDVLPIGSKAGAISTVDDREHLASVVGLSSLLRTISPYVPDPFFWRGAEASDTLVSIGRTCIVRRLESRIERGDILSQMLAIHRSSKTSTVQDLVSESVTLLIAGSDTTSNSISAAMFYIITHPRVHTKLLQELESAFGPCGTVSACDTCSDLQYLQNVIHESLRLFAPTATGLPRVVPGEGVECCGYWLPGGTEVSIPSYTIQHDTSIWGEDADIFRPERWSEDPSLLRCLMTFGFGPRACLGRYLATLEMKMVISALVLRYEFIVRSDVIESTEGFMHKPLHMWVKMRRRTPEIA